MNVRHLHMLCGLFPLTTCLMLAGADASRKDARFGVMTHFAHGWETSLVDKVSQSGVGSVRDEIYWRDVEPQRGVYRYSERYLEMMAALGRRGIEPLVVLSFENDLYDGGATPHSNEAINAYARYGAQVASRFPAQIKAVEIWNEYNGTFVRGPAESNRAATYVRTLRAAYQELKRARPELIVVGGGTAGVPLPYWEKLLAAGALDSMDALSVHPYRYHDAPEGLETDIGELVALVKKYNGGRTKPVWVTEIGWNVHAPTGAGDLTVDDRVQAEFMVRAYALLLSAGVERVYWYLFRDYNEMVMGLVRAGTDSSPKLGFTAMATLTQQLKHATFVARDDTPPEIYSLRFKRPSGESVRVMWSTQPRSVVVAGATGVTDIQGRSLGTRAELQLGEAPLYVVGDVRNLPPRTTKEIANSHRGFADAQGTNGWSYGFISEVEGNVFKPMPTYTADDWRSSWTADLPHLSISAKEQHPSVQNGLPVSVVRRWQSDHTGTVRVVGKFRAGKSDGDGVGVSVAVNGTPRARTLLGGSSGTSVVERFDFIQRVEPGSTIDFVVDPGPATSVDFDGTTVAAAISTTDS
jgi:hypothetical protein